MDGPGVCGDAESSQSFSSAAGDCGQSLPTVIRSLFDCSSTASFEEVLRALGVGGSDVRESPRRCYLTEVGTLVVPVWHDEIEQDPDGSWLHWIDGYCWRLDAAASRGGGGAAVATTLQRHVGRDVHVVHLRREFAEDGQVITRSVALDLVMWRLEAAGQQWFVARRPPVPRYFAGRDASRIARNSVPTRQFGQSPEFAIERPTS
jgi:hypothetical protein